MVLVSALRAAHELPNRAHDSAAKASVLSLGETLFRLTPSRPEYETAGNERY